MLRLPAALIAAAALCFAATAAWAETSATETITVHLSSFAFTPQILHLRVGVPVNLHLVNDSNGGHDWSSPGLFAAAVFPSGAPPAGGTVELGPQHSADIQFVPRVAGTYKVECTHFLHGLFGMTGQVIVDAPAQ